MKQLFFILITAITFASCTKEHLYKKVTFDFSQLDQGTEHYQLKFTDSNNQVTTVNSWDSIAQVKYFKDGTYTIEMVELLPSGCSPACDASATQVLTRGEPIATVTSLLSTYTISINCR